MAIPTFDSHHRALAHQTVDAIFDHIESIASRPVVEWRSSGELRELVRLDGKTSDPRELIDLLTRYSIQLHHPSYIGHQVCPPFPTAVVADLVISALNQSTAVWEMSPIATVIEQEVIRWLADRAGYSAEAEGTAVSGGSAANLTALLAARARWIDSSQSDRPVILTSADAHYSIARAASIMGVAPDDVVKIETDDAHRMSTAALRAALDEVRESGGDTLAIVATAGSTATGAFDDLEEAARLRDKYGTWLHVDAAHGASVLLNDSLRHLVKGLEKSDSFAWDPHKMLWMPLSLGAVFVRDGNWLRRAFQADAPYLFHAERANENIGAMTIQCSKRADAIKLWMTLKTLGTAPLSEALARVTEIAHYAYERVVASDDFEAMHEPEFNIFCFRYRGSDELNGAIREALMRSGEAWITSTILKERRVLRITVINPQTGREEIDAMLAGVRRAAAELPTMS